MKKFTVTAAASLLAMGLFAADAPAAGEVAPPPAAPQNREMRAPGRRPMTPEMRAEMEKRRAEMEQVRKLVKEYRDSKSEDALEKLKAIAAKRLEQRIENNGKMQKQLADRLEKLRAEEKTLTENKDQQVELILREMLEPRRGRRDGNDNNDRKAGENGDRGRQGGRRMMKRAEQ